MFLLLDISRGPDFQDPIFQGQFASVCGAIGMALFLCCLLVMGVCLANWLSGVWRRRLNRRSGL